MTHYWVDKWTFKKNSKKNKIKNSKKPRSDTWHTPGLTRVHFKKIKIKIKKNLKKPRSDTWQSLFMAVNDLNGVSKK